MIREFINLTPHDIHIYSDDSQKLVTFPRSGMIARMEESDRVQVQESPIPIFSSPRYTNISRSMNI